MGQWAGLGAVGGAEGRGGVEGQWVGLGTVGGTGLQWAGPGPIWRGQAQVEQAPEAFPGPRRGPGEMEGPQGPGGC